MKSYFPITTLRHAGMRWRGPADYRFAAGDQWAPILAQEAPRAGIALPLAFIRSEHDFRLIAAE
jgi:hypothetical protein